MKNLWLDTPPTAEGIIALVAYEDGEVSVKRSFRLSSGEFSFESNEKGPVKYWMPVPELPEKESR